MSKTETAPEKRSFRACRGSSWYFTLPVAARAYRSRDNPGGRYSARGVRLIEVLDKQADCANDDERK